MRQPNPHTFWFRANTNILNTTIDVLQRLLAFFTLFTDSIITAVLVWAMS